MKSTGGRRKRKAPEQAPMSTSGARSPDFILQAAAKVAESKSTTEIQTELRRRGIRSRRGTKHALAELLVGAEHAAASSPYSVSACPSAPDSPERKEGVKAGGEPQDGREGKDDKNEEEAEDEEEEENIWNDDDEDDDDDDDTEESGSSTGTTSDFTPQAISPLPSRFASDRAGFIPEGEVLPRCRWCQGSLPLTRRTFCCDGCVHEHRIRTSGTAVRAALEVRDRGRCVLCGVDCIAAIREANRCIRAAVDPKRRQAISSASASASASAMELPPSRETIKGWAQEALTAFQQSAQGQPFGGHLRLSARGRGPPKVMKGSVWQADHRLAVVEGGAACGLDNLRTLCCSCHLTETRSLMARRKQQRAISASAPAPGRPGPATSPIPSPVTPTSASSASSTPTKAKKKRRKVGRWIRRGV